MSWSFDRSGKRVREETAAGRITSWTFDGKGQQVGEERDDGTRVTTSYTPRRETARVDEPGGVWTMTWDAEERLETVAEGIRGFTDSQRTTGHFKPQRLRVTQLSGGEGILGAKGSRT